MDVNRCDIIDEHSSKVIINIDAKMHLMLQTCLNMMTRFYVSNTCDYTPSHVDEPNVLECQNKMINEICLH